MTRWTPEMIAWLRERAPQVPNAQLCREYAERFGAEIGYRGIKSAKYRYGIHTDHPRGLRKGDPSNPSRIWSEQHLDWLRRAYRNLPERGLEAAMDKAFPGHGFSAQQISAAISNHRIRSGRDGRFQPGSVSWNTGLNGYNAGGRSCVTRFQPGHQGAVKYPLGHERLTKNGYLEVKVAERNPYTGGPARYRLKHRLVWEQAHGPVPRHHALVFADGDKTNCDLGNLILIRRADLVRLNQDGHGALTGELRLAAIRLAQVKTVLAERAKGCASHGQ